MRFVSSEAKLQVEREKIKNGCDFRKPFKISNTLKVMKAIIFGTHNYKKTLYDKKRFIKYSQMVMNKKQPNFAWERCRSRRKPWNFHKEQ